MQTSSTIAARPADPEVGLWERIAQVGRIPGFVRLGSASLVLGLAHSLALPYLSLFALTEAHLSPRQLGAYLLVSAISNVPVTAWLGRLSDRGFGRKRAVVLSLACAIVGYAALSQLRSFWALLLNTVLLLALGRAAFAQMFALARARFESTGVPDLTLAINTMRMFLSVAWVLGPALGAVLVAQIHFQGLYLVIAALHLLILVMVWPVDAPAAPAIARGGGTAVLRYVARPAIAATVVAFGLLFMCASLNMIVFPLYVVETLGGTAGDVGGLLGLCAGLEIPLMVGSALAAGRLGKRRLIVASAFLYGAYFFWVAAVRRPWPLYPAQLVNATVVSIVMGLGMSYFQDQLPGEPGVSTALYANAMTLGSVLSGLLFAALAGPFGHRGVLVVGAACCLLACALLALAHRNLQTGRP